MKELWHISAFRQTYPVYYLATKSEIATGLSKHFTRLSINMKELYVNNIINTLCALSLLCALLGNALLPCSSLPLQRTIWLPMLIIGMASFSQGFTNKQKKGTSLDWYFILTLWTIVIDIYWNSFSITHTAWIITCGLFMRCTTSSQSSRHFLTTAICLCCVICAVAKIADRFFLLPPSFKLFDNEAGYAAALILGMPSCLHVFRSHKAIGVITSALTLAGIVATDSRTAWIGALMILSYWCKRTFFQDFKFRRWHWCIVSILSIIAISTLWMMRPESVLGRWYIDKISTNLIETYPLTGLGHCGFHREYMNAQATYFMSHDANSSFGILADNIPHAFNEAISFTINYGIIGFLLLSVCLYKNLRQTFNNSNQTSITTYNKSTYIRCMLVGAVILSMTSYPFKYSYAVLVTLSAASFLDFPSKDSNRRYRLFNIVIAAFICTSGCLTAIGEYFWLKADRESTNGLPSQAIKFYKQAMNLLPTRVELAYNYAADLNIWGRYAESQEVLNCLSSYLNDYDTELLSSDNAYNLGQTKKCFQHLEKASLMIPNRFFPLWSRFDLAQETNQTKEATQLAYSILRKPVKIASTKVEQMKKDAHDWLKEVTPSNATHSIPPTQ